MITPEEIYKMKREFLSYKIIYHCRKCGERIETYWDGWEIKGDFKSDDILWSEYLDCIVLDPLGIICMSCMSKYDKILFKFKGGR